MKSARRLVVVVIEFAARVKFGENHLHSAYAESGVLVYGNASAVVKNARATVRIYSDFYPVAITVGDLVHRVVYYLPQYVVKTFDPRRTYIHSRAQPDRVQPLKHLYVLCFVFFCQCLFSLFPVGRISVCARPSVLL